MWGLFVEVGVGVGVGVGGGVGVGVGVRLGIFLKVLGLVCLVWLVYAAVLFWGGVLRLGFLVVVRMGGGGMRDEGCGMGTAEMGMEMEMES